MPSASTAPIIGSASRARQPARRIGPADPLTGRGGRACVSPCTLVACRETITRPPGARSVSPRAPSQARVSYTCPVGDRALTGRDEWRKRDVTATVAYVAPRSEKMVTVVLDRFIEGFTGMGTSQ